MYHLYFDDARELSMAFFRYTEFYESKYDQIRGKKFTWVQQMGFYCREYLQDNNADWSYGSDWGGFNIPLSVIKQVHDLGIPDPNHYDSLMIAIHDMVFCDSLGKETYLVGTSSSTEKSLLRHELTHAMFHIDEEYRKESTLIIESAPRKLEDALKEVLRNANYPDKVHIDEIQAYITTGEGGHFDDVEENGLEELRSCLRALHKKTYKKFYNGKEEVG